MAWGLYMSLGRQALNHGPCKAFASIRSAALRSSPASLVAFTAQSCPVDASGTVLAMETGHSSVARYELYSISTPCRGAAGSSAER